MRSAQIYRALNQIPNRFSLCMHLSRGVRLTHTVGQSTENSVSTAIAGIESGKFLAARGVPAPVAVETMERIPPMPVHQSAIFLVG